MRSWAKKTTYTSSLAPQRRARRRAGSSGSVCIVYSNVFQGARLAKGETLLVHGGGGIGTTAQKADIVAAVTANAWPLVEAGAVRPVIDCELPMTQAGEAHEIMAASTHTGKIVLRTK